MGLLGDVRAAQILVVEVDKQLAVLTYWRSGQSSYSSHHAGTPGRSTTGQLPRALATDEPTMSREPSSYATG